MKRRNCRGRADLQRSRRRAESIHAAAVQEPGQSGDSPQNDRRGNLARHRRQGGHPRRRRRHRRDDHRRRRGHQGAQADVQVHRRRAGDEPGHHAEDGRTGLKPGPHKIQGIGGGFIPDNLNLKIVDEVDPGGTDDDAFETARQLAKEEGMLCGISCGAAMWAALQVAKSPGERGQADRGRAARIWASAI